MKSSACPSENRLASFVLGRLEELELERVIAHAETCSKCRRRLEELDHHTDALLRRLREPLRADPVEREPNLHNMLGSLTTSSSEVTVMAPPAGYGFLAPPQRDDELGSLGDFRILRELGAGGMGVVFLAEDAHLRRQVALKVLSPQLASNDAARQRFLREARATAAVRNDHVVTIHHVGEQDGTPYLVMELLRGETLEARLKRGDKIPLPESMRIGREIAEGLAAAHERGLIHRDVKPANVWLEEKDGRVKLLDFGLVHTASEESGLTRVGDVVGTPAFMSPEQARGQPIDARSDLFSLGSVLYQMCSGTSPFLRETPFDTMLAVAQLEAKPLRERNPQVGDRLAALIQRLLDKDPTRRPISARKVVEELTALAARPRRKLSLIMGICLIASLLAGSIWAIVLWQRERDKPTELEQPPVVAEEKSANEEPPKPQPKPVDDAFIKDVGKCLPNRQMQMVAAKMKELNPAFDGSYNYQKINPKDDPDPKRLVLRTDKVTDLTPFAALTHLDVLWCSGSAAGKGSFADLNQLKGMKLLRLDVSNNAIEDLSPLRGMKLLRLDINNNAIHDLSPLKGMELLRLNISNNAIHDLSPLKELPKLEMLWCDYVPERDGDVLQSIKTLKQINGVDVKQFWLENKKPAAKL